MVVFAVCAGAYEKSGMTLFNSASSRLFLPFTAHGFYEFRKSVYAAVLFMTLVFTFEIGRRFLIRLV